MGYCRPGGRVTGGEVLIDGRSAGRDGGRRAAPAARRHRVLHPPGPGHGAESGAADRPPAVGDARGPRRRQRRRTQRRARVRETLEEVALPSDDEFLRRYPHQLSGGQQQRVAIAMAFACRPHVIVCDEPTTGLDVTTQARVLQDDPRAVPEPPGGGAVRQPRPRRRGRAGRPRGGHVRRADRRARPARRDLRQPAPPLHAPAAARGARPRGQAGRGRDPRARAAAGPPAPRAASSSPAATWPSTSCREQFPEATEFEGGHLVHCYRAADAPDRAADHRDRRRRPPSPASR